MPRTLARRVAIAVRAAVLATVAAATLLASPATAAPGDRKFITLRGRVADPAGLPLADVRVEAAGTREAIALTSPEGRFSLTLDLGTLHQLRLHPAVLSVKARRAAYRIRLPGGAPALALELKLGVETGQPVLQARSNFGLIAEAVIDALAPSGDRTAVINVSFVAHPGPERDSSATVPEGYRSAPIAEPWVGEPIALAPPDAPRRGAPAPDRRPETIAPARESPPDAAEPARPAREGKAKPESGKVRKATERKPPQRAERDAEPRAAARIVTPPPAPAPPRPTRVDSLRLRHEAEQRAAVAAAQARRDSLFRSQRTQALAMKAVTDSIRAVREAYEDSARRARFGLPPRLATRPRERKPDPPAGASESFAPNVGSVSVPGGLQRVGVKSEAAALEGADAGMRAQLEADTCVCRVRGTVETEFHRLLANPMRVEVSIRELPALRDTIDLFMGSPRAFEFERVPCGRWSLALRPFSERPFGVTTPDEVAPFDCRQRGLRQVRIVIAPTRSGR